MAATNIEISVRGKAITVPALDINGKKVIVSGRWIRVAAINAEEWLETELEDPEEFIKRLNDHQSNGFRADIFTFTQKLPAMEPKYPYPMEWENVAAIRLSSYAEWWTKGISGDARKDIRRSAKRGVVVKVTDFNDELVRGIVEIYNESPIRQGKPFWHYQKGFDTVKREISTYLERSIFIGAYHKDELIGFMKIVLVGKVAAMMQFLTKTSHYDKRPSNALIAKAVEHFAKKGMSYLTYGKYRYWKKGTRSITKFKHRVGFEEVRLPRFYIPLTTKGKICMALGLHRDLVAILSGRLIHPLLTLRSMWYKLVFSRKPV